MNRNFKIKIANKRTREQFILSPEEFKEKFSKELELALQSFARTKKNKKLYLLPIIGKQDYKNEFYSNLQWNFNHYSNSIWYIERFI